MAWIGEGKEQELEILEVHDKASGKMAYLVADSILFPLVV